MYSVTKTIEFCYGHRLLNYEGKCRHLHGHNGKAEIELSSETLDRRGMVQDFSEIQRVIHAWIDRALDHKMLLHHRDPALPSLRELGEPLFVLKENPTAEAIAQLIFDYAASQGWPVTSVRLWETNRSVATYRRPAARAVGGRPEAAAARTRRRRASRRRRSTVTAA